LWEKYRLLQWSAETRTALSALSRKLTKKSFVHFPFLRLPLELQLIALSYTGLVVSPRKRSGILVCSKLSSIGWCCGDCQDNCDAQYQPHPFCWCNRDFFYSSSCTCHQHLNSALFAKSKAIRQYALKIAFSENKFLITHRPWKSLEDTAETFSLIPSTRLQWIRHLTIGFEELHLRRNSR